jgi:hypothetical protein
MKSLILLILLPSMLCGTCRDCDFPYQQYLHEYHEHYEHTAQFYAGKVITEKHLKTDREKAIFFSGGAFSLEQMMMMED